jgi:PKD domain
MHERSTALPPLMPPPPDGISLGQVGVGYAFSVKTHDPMGSEISCRFDWGDGQQSDWTPPKPNGEPHTLDHCWEKPGRYGVCARARNARGAMTDWGPAVRVTIEELGAKAVHKESQPASAGRTLGRQGVGLCG